MTASFRQHCEALEAPAHLTAFSALALGASDADLRAAEQALDELLTVYTRYRDALRAVAVMRAGHTTAATIGEVTILDRRGEN